MLTLEDLLARCKSIIVSTPGALANLLRGAVRCAVPVFVFVVYAGLLISAQGRDVLLVLIERAAENDNKGISGLLFLGAGSAALSLSIWYSMRWLLTAEMPALMLSSKPGWFRRWLPRLFGAAVPALVAIDLYLWVVPSNDGSAQPWTEIVDAAKTTAYGFAVLSAVLLVFYWARGWAMAGLQSSGWMAETPGRMGKDPGLLRQQQDLPKITLRIMVWSTVLSVFVALLILLFPVTLPRVIGAAAIAALALASINLVGSFVLTYLPLRKSVPNLGPWVILYAGLIGSCNDNHVVKPAADADATPLQRIAIKEDFLAYLNQVDPDDNPGVPVLFVASEGGGIRAAYWTAAVLEELRKKVPQMERHLYSVSGVSGGSVGLAAWLVSLRDERCGNGRDSATPPVTKSLGQDFLSPAVAGMLYYDLMQRFIPMAIPAWDRSRALEEGWQRVFAHATGRPFESTLDALYEPCDEGKGLGWLPHLMLNSTVVESGQRSVLTRLDTNPKDAPVILTDHLDAMDQRYTARQQSLAGLVHHSARFPVVSPAGTIEELIGDDERISAFRLVDGGYFDNSGVHTALEMIRYLQRSTDRHFKPVLVLVRNAPDAEPRESGTNNIFPEVGSIIGALASVRSAHAVSARESAGGLPCAEEAEPTPETLCRVDLVVGKDTPAERAPLGWSLSESVKHALDREAASVATAAGRDLMTRFGWTMETRQ
jgi:hypothetical protein